MIRLGLMRNYRRLALVLGVFVAGAGSAAAQSNVGTGPLTASLADTEPTEGVFSAGPVRIAPGITVREIGWDTNVFNEPEVDSPKEDFVASLTPDVSFFSRLPFVRVAAYAGAEMTYYQKFESERSMGHAVRGRVDFLLSRMRPFIGGGHTETRTRPNGEIDVRADRKDDEISGGLAFDLSPHSLLYGSAIQTSQIYDNALEDGINLSRTLSRDSHHYQAGLKTDITPLLSVQLYGSYQDDEFVSEPIRNSESYMATAVFRFAPQAVVTGAIDITYRDMTFADPELKPQRGFFGNAVIVYPIMEIGRLSAVLTRGFEYSFDIAEGYYIEEAVALSYTHRLFGDVDGQVRGGRAVFHYDSRPSQPSHIDTLDTVGGSIGYNLRNRTRIALNYEVENRKSPELARKNYERRRTYVSWQLAF